MIRKITPGILFSLLGLTLLFVLPSVAQKKPRLGEKKLDLAYQYEAQDDAFWQEGSDLIAKKKFADVVNLIQKQLKRFPLPELKGQEAQMLLARALAERGFKVYAAQIHFDLAKMQLGSRISEAALIELSRYAVSHAFWPKQVKNLVINTNFSENLHPEALAFVSYFRYWENKKSGYRRWASKNLKNIKKGTSWWYMVRYARGIKAVKENKLKTAVKIFKSLVRSKRSPRLVKEMSKRHYGRLNFEKGKFKRHSSVLRKVSANGFRDEGRLLLEKAWNAYYRKKFAKALGHLKVLEAPFYQSSAHFEQYILKFIILRELCMYRGINQTVKQFKKKYQPAMTRINSRKALRNDRELFAMAAQDSRFQRVANLIGDIRLEKKQLQEESWLSFKKKAMQSFYRTYDHRLRKYLELYLEPEARRAANQLLSAFEQVEFVEYVTKLDKLKISKNEAVKYKAPKVSKTKFDVLHWPVEDEFWYDELSKIHVLADSQCL